MYSHQMIQRQGREVRETPEDPNQWHVEIFNIPLHFNKEDIVYFIWKTLEKCRGLKKFTNPIIRSDFIEDTKCIRLFFRSKEEAVNCLDLNGILYGQKAFYMKSPLTQRDHPQIKTDSLHIKKLRHKVQESFNKLCIYNFPPNTLEFEIINMLRIYGELKAFQPVLTNHILTHSYFELETAEATEQCLSKLNGQKVKGKAISVKRAAIAREVPSRTATTTKVRAKSSLFQKDPHSFYLTFDTVGYFKGMKISCVLLLRNMIQSPTDREFIKQDILKEMQKIGPISRFISKEKNIYAEYQRVEYAQIAYLLLTNRKYQGKVLEISFYDPINFADDILV